MAPTHEHAHLIGRLAGEAPSHPRQKVVRWLTENGREGDLEAFNRVYAQTLERHEDIHKVSKESYATYEAFGALYPHLGGAGSPEVDDLWHSALG